MAGVVEALEIVEAVESRRPKLIRPEVHGIIDYAHATFFFTMGVVCSRGNKRAAAAAFATSGFVLVQSLLTDYRYGVRPVLSFATHCRMDAAFAAGSWLLPRVFGFEETAAAKVFQANTVVEASVVAMTDWSSERARAERLAA